MPTQYEQLLALAQAQQQPEGTVQATVQPGGASAQQPTGTQVAGLQTLQPSQGVLPQQQGVPIAQQQQLTKSQSYVNDKTGREVVVFSTGDPQPVVAFDQAMTNFDKGNKNTPGFVAMDAGAASKLREGFNSLTAPVQNAAKQLDDPQARINMLPDMLKIPLKGLLRIPANMVKTPEEAASNVGTALGTVATGGVSLPMQMIGVGLATAGARLLSGYMFGSGPDVAKAVMQGSLAAGAQGAQGVIRQVIGQGMSQKAGNDTAKGIIDLIKKENPTLANDPNVINAYMSSGPNLSKIVQKGMQGVREDVQEIASGFVPSYVESLTMPNMAGQGVAKQTVTGTVGDALVYNMNTQGARVLDKATQATLRAKGREYYRLTNTLLDSVDNPKAYAQAKDAVNDVILKMGATVKDSLKGQPQGIIDRSMKALDDAVVQQNILMNKSMATAQLFAALKRSSAETGWNIKAFQEEVQSYYNNPAYGHMVQQAGEIAGRGAPLTAGVDRTFTSAHTIPSWLPGLGGFEIPAMGQRYIGHVRNAPIAVTGNVGGKAALESFVKER